MKTLMLALLALLLAPAAASAANLSVQGGSSLPRDPVPFRYSFPYLLAGPGERNDVEVTLLAAQRFAIRDAGAPVAIGFGCVAAADGWVECAPGRSDGGDVMRFSLGDGDDRFRGLGDVAVEGSGGSGDDELLAGTSGAEFEGGEGDDALAGGPRADVLSAGAGADRVSGGDGDDALYESRRYVMHDNRPIPFDDRGSDTYDGGSGRDSILYVARTDDLTIDLGAGRGPDGDVLTSIEGVIGGEGADVLRGSGGDDTLGGGESTGDTLIGLGGDDRLTGRGAGTTILAGPGDDTITGSGLDAPVSCGPGEDRIVADHEQAIAFPGRDCERIEAKLFTLTRIETAAKRLRFVARATYPERTPLCGLRAHVRTIGGARELGRAAVRIPDRARRTVTVTSRRALPARIAVELRPQRCDRRGRMSAVPAQTLRFPLETR